MTKHLSEIEALLRKTSGNIVIAIQEELFKGHFFFGKMSVVKLKPLKPQTLTSIFKIQFPNSWTLIRDDAIILLAELSRGVFRRFLKYLSLTIEKFMLSGAKPPIKPENVEDTITIDVIIEDMELELYEIFKDARMRRQAIELLNHLRKVGRINQKQIADFLNVTMTTAGRIINKLDYRYIQRERGKGREWLISLKV